MDAQQFFNFISERNCFRKMKTSVEKINRYILVDAADNME